MTREDADRPRGFLTPKDREFLRGEQEELQQATVTQKRHRIRERIRNAILDFPLLRQLDYRERELIFGDLALDESGPRGDAELYYSVVDMLQFAFLGLKEQGIDPKRPTALAIWNIESIYHRWYQDAWVDVDVDISVNFNDHVTLEEAVEAYRNDEDMSNIELIALYHSGEISRRELQQLAEDTYDPLVLLTLLNEEA